ncbi:hypothetical protein LX32DRAFT_643926 [Colletotrichum zoysiae]|uniref:Uncharacterized protein n=1 Tax=Colletotrichum zoysiae TaxID=1216348 RepID=A0AAD9LVV6_9PEZI|nr:hypothetical protein LX32DRAFT_643926 [Colletotrichum zoysiae]
MRHLSPVFLTDLDLTESLPIVSNRKQNVSRRLRLASRSIASPHLISGCHRDRLSIRPPPPTPDHDPGTQPAYSYAVLTPRPHGFLLSLRFA